MPDLLIVSYVALMIVLQFRSSEATVTNSMRLVVNYTLDISIAIFRTSGPVTIIGETKKTLLAFVIAVFPLCLIAGFETAKRVAIILRSYRWTESEAGNYVHRSDILRAMTDRASPIVLGSLIMVALWSLFGPSAVNSGKCKRIGFILLSAGLLAPFRAGRGSAL